MKHTKHTLILALALCALPAAAEVMATAKNAAGGQIVMSTDACQVAKLGGDTGAGVAFATSADGRVTMGCWQTYNGKVLIRYTDGDVRMYDPVIFEIDKSTEAYRRFESKQRKENL